MTGTRFAQDGRGDLTITSVPEIQDFGPAGFTGDGQRRLFDETVATRPGGVKARARGFWSEAAEKAVKWVGDRATEVVGDVIRGYPRAAYARTGSGYGDTDAEGIDKGKLEIYRAVITGGYPVAEASQGFLKRITGIAKRYVYGACLDGQIFVDSFLKKHSRAQELATLFHEAGHAIDPAQTDESIIEGEGARYALYLSEHDSDYGVRRRARLAYKGFLEARYGGLGETVPSPSGIETGGPELVLA